MSIFEGKKIVLSIIFIIFIISSVSSQTYATTLTVCSMDCPFYAIQQAMDSAVDGDEIYVKSGIYKEHLILSKSITLKGEDRETTIIDGNGEGKCISVLSSHNVIIEGFTLKGCNGIYASSSSNLNINNNLFLGFEQINCNYDSFKADPDMSGVTLTSSVSSKIYNNLIKNNQHGILLFISHNSLIYENNIENNCDGIYIQTTNNVEINKNTIQLNLNRGILIYASENTSIFDNNIIKNTRKGLELYGYQEPTLSSGVNIYKNDFDSNGQIGLFLGTTKYNIITDNQFFNSKVGIKQDNKGSLIQNKNIIEHNTFRYNDKQDISLQKSAYNTIFNNKVCKMDFTEINNISYNDCPYDDAPKIIKSTNILKTDKAKINFSYKVIDDLDSFFHCSLKFGDLIKTETVFNNTLYMYEFITNISEIKNWTLTCTDSDENSIEKSGSINIVLKDNEAPEIIYYTDLSKTNKTKLNFSFIAIDDFDYVFNCSLIFGDIIKNETVFNNTLYNYEYIIENNGIVNWTLICIDSYADSINKSGAIEILNTKITDTQNTIDYDNITIINNTSEYHNKELNVLESDETRDILKNKTVSNMENTEVLNAVTDDSNNNSYVPMSYVIFVLLLIYIYLYYTINSIIISKKEGKIKFEKEFIFASFIQLIIPFLGVGYLYLNRWIRFVIWWVIFLFNGFYMKNIIGGSIYDVVITLIWVMTIIDCYYLSKKDSEHKYENRIKIEKEKEIILNKEQESRRKKKNELKKRIQEKQRLKDERNIKLKKERELRELKEKKEQEEKQRLDDEIKIKLKKERELRVLKEKKALYDYEQSQIKKGLKKYKGKWVKASKYKKETDTDTFLAKCKSENRYKGLFMVCDDCDFVWKIRKDYSLPIRCTACGSDDIKLDREKIYSDIL